MLRLPVVSALQVIEQRGLLRTAAPVMYGWLVRSKSSRSQLGRSCPSADLPVTHEPATIVSTAATNTIQSESTFFVIAKANAITAITTVR